MIIGVPKEVKVQECRVAITPEGVAKLRQSGHEVLIELGAGIGSGFSDQAYQQAGAVIVSVEEAWAAELVVKVKEPIRAEYNYLQGQMLFTFLHLAGVDRELTTRLMNSGTTAIAYETVVDAQGRLPILAPMSAIAGNMAALMGSYYLARFNQGNGVQLAKVLGRRHGKALVIGDGVVGMHAAQTLNSMGASVFLAGLDRTQAGILSSADLNGVEYLYSQESSIAQHCSDADLVVGAVLNVGEKTPHIVTEAMIRTMQEGAVVVDVSIDQGGCIETSVATTHEEPTFIKHGVTHYCVANMPGAYPRTATIALCDVSIGYIEELANSGILKFMRQRRGAVNIYQSKIINSVVAQSLKLRELSRLF
ncbi:MAG: alanine dehydrogenase [Methyloprofundus sp.]|nr:alanine dehydrogenase [Methyloprofundus sp.]